MTGRVCRKRGKRGIRPLYGGDRRGGVPAGGPARQGNNSLRLTEEYGLSRYSLKLEFDQFIDGGNYYGLDKLSLDASFQDNSYLKTYMPMI